MAPSSITIQEHGSSAIADLRLLHFNDVYHVEAGSRDPVGGIPRFQTLCNHYRNDKSFEGQPQLLTLFSGDAFNPSVESSVTKGGHMVPVLNNLGVNCACVGNHDLDFGIPQYQHLTSQCNFPWLLANVFEPGTETPLGDSPKTHMLTSSNGIKIGLIGIAEQEWLATVNALPPNLPYEPAVEAVKKLAPKLRQDGADMVILICHQREVHDNKLAAECPPGLVDLILAGHDHDYRYSKINDIHILCSGSDFKQLSYLEACRKPGVSGWSFNITRRDITKDIPEDPLTLAIMDKLFSSFRAKLDKPIGYTATGLDARFETVRKRESNMGNFIADLCRNYYDGDCALVVGGTIRGDQIYPSGVIKLKDIMDCFPFEDPTVMVRATGKDILAALENGVSMYPALEGRFPQVSNIHFTFDPSKPPNQRVLNVSIGGAPLDEKKEYKLVTREYTVQGGDGFSSLKTTERGGRTTYIVDEENGHLLSMLLRQYFMSLKVLGRWKNWNADLGQHWGAVHDELHSVHPVRDPIVPGEPAAEHDDKGKNSTAEASNASTEKEPGDNVPGLVGQALRNDNPRAHKKRKPNPAQGPEITHPGLSDSESETDAPAVPHEPSTRERELKIMRKVTRKWWRATGLQGHPAMNDSSGEGVHWTKGIAPRVEGRIRIIGVDA